MLRKAVIIGMALILIWPFLSCKKKGENIKRKDDGVKLEIPLDGSLQNPAFSPDGKSIVFTHYKLGYESGAAELFLYIIDAGNHSTLISDGSGNVNHIGSAWNGMISSIIFSSSREPHNEIYLILQNGSSGNEIRITSRSDSAAFFPSMDPLGEWVVFESHKVNETGSGIIMKYALNGSSAYIALTAVNDDCRKPNWAPNGNKILFQKITNGQWDIWTMNIDGTNARKVTTDTGNETDACFTADGLSIIYSSDLDLDLPNIYKIPVIGGTPLRLSDYKGYDGAPSVSPTGNRVVFESRWEDPDGTEGTSLVLLDL